MLCRITSETIRLLKNQATQSPLRKVFKHVCKPYRKQLLYAQVEVLCWLTTELNCRSQIKYMANVKQVSELTKLPRTIQLLKVNSFECFPAPGSIP